MNTIASFRKCTLTDEELLSKVDELTDKLYSDDYKSILTRHVPARPDSDYDLLVGELLLRFKDRLVKNEKTVSVANPLCRKHDGCTDTDNPRCRKNHPDRLRCFKA